MQEQGWDVTVDLSVDSLGSVVSVDQADAYDAAYAGCTGQFPANNLALADVTPQQWTKLHADESATAECLRGLGYTIPEIPTEQTFIEQYPSDPWSAYSYLPDLGQQDNTAANEACPQPTL